MAKHVRLESNIPKKLKQEITEMAKENNLSIQELLIQLLVEALSSSEPQPVPKDNEPPGS